MALHVGIFTLNAKGLFSNSQKRASIFYHCMMQNAQIIFLQETHSTADIEEKWRTEWETIGGGKIFFSHGDSNSKGVLIMFKKNFTPNNDNEYIFQGKIKVNIVKLRM